MNVHGSATSQSRSVTIVTNRNRENLWLLSEELFPKCRLALLQLKSTCKSLLASLLRHACLLSKFQTDSTYKSIAHVQCLNMFHLCCGLWLCVLNHKYVDIGASTRVLGCSLCLHYLYLWPSFEFYTCLWDFYKWLWEINTSSWPVRS